jgi:hypothetical protein
MTITYHTKDHPEAGGKKAVPGQREWQLLFPLDTGESLLVKIGRRGRNALVEMLSKEGEDDKEQPPEVRGVKEALRFALGNLEWAVNTLAVLDVPGYRFCSYRCRFCLEGNARSRSELHEIVHTPGCPYRNALTVLKLLEA